MVRLTCVLEYSSLTTILAQLKRDQKPGENVKNMLVSTVEETEHWLLKTSLQRSQ